MTNFTSSDEKRQRIDSLLNGNYLGGVKSCVEQAFKNLNSDDELTEKLTDVLFEALSTTQDYLILINTQNCLDPSELQKRYIQASQAIQELNWLIYRPNTLPEQVCVALMAVPVMLASMLFFGLAKSIHFLFEHLISTISLPGALIGAIGGFCAGLAEGALVGYLATCQFNRFAFFNPAEYQIQLNDASHYLETLLANPSQVPDFVV